LEKSLSFYTLLLRPPEEDEINLLTVQDSLDLSDLLRVDSGLLWLQTSLESINHDMTKAIIIFGTMTLVQDLNAVRLQDILDNLSVLLPELPVLVITEGSLQAASDSIEFALNSPKQFQVISSKLKDESIGDLEYIENMISKYFF